MASEWMQKWYYKNYDQVHGPISQFELKKKFHAEEINGETFIRNLTTLPQWRQIRHVPKLIQWLISLHEFKEVKIEEEPEVKTKQMRKEEKRMKKVRKKIKINLKTEAELGMNYSIGADVDIMRQNRWVAGQVVAYDPRTCKYRVELTEDKKRERGYRRYPVSYPVLVTEMRSPVVATKDRAVAALCAAASDPSINPSTIRHLVHIAQTVGVDLGRLPNPGRLHVVTVVITGDLMIENLVFTLARNDIIFDIKAEICRRIQIIPVYQRLTLDGEKSHVELDDFNTLEETGFQPNKRYLIRLSSRSNIPNNQALSVKQHHELKAQLERTKKKLQRVREKIGKLAQELRYNEMMTHVQEDQKTAKDVEFLQQRVDSVSLVVKQHENQIVEQIMITRRELTDWEEEYQQLKDELKNMLDRDEIPGVHGATPKLYKVWERLRVAKLNMKLLESATEAKE